MKMYKKNKSVSMIITVLYAIQVVLMIFIYQMNLTFISVTIDGYMWIVSTLISCAFLRILWHAEEEYQNYGLVILPVAYLLSFNLQIIAVLGLMGIKACTRYERTVFNKSLQVVYSMLIVVAIATFTVLPAVFSGYQEMQVSIYDVFESPDGDNLIEVRNFRTISYLGGNNIELHFNHKKFGILKSEIAFYDRMRRPQLDIEWHDNDTVTVNRQCYQFVGDTVVEVHEVLE